MQSVGHADHRLGRGAAFAVIVAACPISLIGYGTRSSFGLCLEPMTVASGWSRETFVLAIASQILPWGIGLLVAGAIVDLYGPEPIFKDWHELPGDLRDWGSCGVVEEVSSLSGTLSVRAQAFRDRCEAIGWIRQ